MKHHVLADERFHYAFHRRQPTSAEQQVSACCSGKALAGNCAKMYWGEIVDSADAKNLKVNASMQRLYAYIAVFRYMGDQDFDLRYILPLCIF